MPKPRLLFVSPRYLLPPDMGGKIRTAHVLRGLKGGRFHVTLLSPAPSPLPAEHANELARLCDDFVSWAEPRRNRLFAYTRLRHVLGPLPVPVATDRSRPAKQIVAKALARANIVVADFLHAAVWLPQRILVPSVLFTHNVEAEIFARHTEIASNPLVKALWHDQLRKMRRFEAQTLRAYDAVVAVSERDRELFRRDYGVTASTIPTGVDLDYFAFTQRGSAPRIAFTASMDSLANIDGVRWFMERVWPLIVQAVPQAEMQVIGRNPDPALVADVKRRGLAWSFTGSVPDVRPFLADASVYVIPLRVGGGTRIKAFEAMAFGLPVVSTKIGIEGLGLSPECHFLEADTEEGFASAVIALLSNANMRNALAGRARAFVETNFSAESVGRVFEQICVAAMQDRGSASLNASPERTPERGTSAA